MGLSAEDYLRQAQALLPSGPAWPREANAYATRLLLALCAEFSNVDGRASALLDEVDPRTAAELLIDWERVAGLPDGCVVDAGIDLSTAQRRAALLARLTMQGSQALSYYIALAADLGYVIEAEEFHAFDVNDDIATPIRGPAWVHAWQVTSELNQPVDFTVASLVTDPLASWSNVVLECVLNRFKPAHTVLVFAYT